ncbi:hypothetical protein [Xanthomonas vesicatoria]|uniref:Uncharacterized protein n=1 Tax=Xanthomonas vesicatoria TaxID=56460 RepID=A0ABS8LGJ7_9XANT|nr:hypothetical protein [Xanthomonas vesicatoria]MCC8624277.1 hypothetical protein [Xanthomonas vesicatoria]MCC8695209.1 hypothetical protein [Xanthomonas vesicatoria]MCC8700891.1 hypothetical protein [Xanthomonas vesicatoria]MDG4491681.1 hypothetical protein [Xanthomonas vesicatoria]
MPIRRVHATMVLNGCYGLAHEGLGNGNNANVPALNIDYVAPGVFLGAVGNPAIFVNAATFALLGAANPAWVLNATIAVAPNFMAMQTMNAAGILIHEFGHAFNVSAGIPNTEANAYVFEIEALARWGASQNNPLSTLGCTRVDIRNFLTGRLPQYRIPGNGNPYLNALRSLVEIM